MGYLERLADELEGQPRALEEFSKLRLGRVRPGSVFVGAGDSYAAALEAFYMSGGKCLALDPYSLATAPEIAEGREVVFVSASGRTSSNVAAAKKVKGLASGTTAVTADQESRLAKSTDRVLKLPITVRPRTSGLLSFTLSLLAVLKLLGLEGACDFRRAFRRAGEDFGAVSFSPGTTYFLGNSGAYPVSMYAAAKVYEVLGAKAHPELLEEFPHMQLFSLAESDSVNVFASFDPSGLGRKLQKALEVRGYDSRLIAARGSTDLERLFHSVFVAQLAVVGKAREQGLSRPAFLSSRDRLGVSDEMIY